MVDERTIKLLEFDKILELLSNFAVSKISKEEILRIHPEGTLIGANSMQQMTEEAYVTTTKYNLAPIIEFDDINQIISKAEIESMLQMSDLLKVARLIRSARILKKEIEGTGDDIVLLKNLVLPMFIQNELEKSINDSIAGENEMKDEASYALKNLRRKIKISDGKLKDKLNSYTRSSEVSKYLQDNLVTVRNGRFVLPVKSECRSFVPGLIHDQSATGATVFIEPFIVVELNNEIASLRLEENLEIERILKILSQMVSNSSKQLKLSQKICIMSDIVYAKSSFTISINGYRPIFNDKGYVNLINARHPLINKNNVTPVNISFGKDYKILLITGPNTGGKTVCLKTVGLFCLMAYSGIGVPSDYGSEISMFDNVFCDIGDEQSISSSLSTFSSHILNIVDITNKITNKSLVLLDEIGGGTDPQEGAALAVGIIKYLELMKSYGVLTTHYGELKEYALLSKNIMNGCMQFDESTLKPTYKMIMGIPGVSNALKIAKTLGLNDYIIDNAFDSLKDEKIQFELVLQNAEKVKHEALKELERTSFLAAELEEDRKKLVIEQKLLEEKQEKINNRAALEVKRIVNNSVEKAEELIEEMKELLKSTDEKSLFIAREKKRELEDLQYNINKNEETVNFSNLKNEDIKVGKKVIIKSFGSVCEIKSLPNHKGEIEVLYGSAILKVKKSDLASFNETKKIINLPKINLNKISSSNLEPTEQEIKVIGLTVFEAIEVLEPCIMSGIGQKMTLKIVHGKGTGALGRGIQNYLKMHSDIKSYRIGGYFEGGAGVTFAEIK